MRKITKSCFLVLIRSFHFSKGYGKFGQGQTNLRTHFWCYMFISRWFLVIGDVHWNNLWHAHNIFVLALTKEKGVYDIINLRNLYFYIMLRHFCEMSQMGYEVFYEKIRLHSENKWLLFFNLYIFFLSPLIPIKSANRQYWLALI